MDHIVVLIRRPPTNSFPSTAAPTVTLGAADSQLLDTWNQYLRQDKLRSFILFVRKAIAVPTLNT